jgi:hypothetical protein
MLATNFESQNSTHKKPFGKVDVMPKGEIWTFGAPFCKR